MKKILCAATLLLASSSAFAGMISHTDSFGTLGSNTDALIIGNSFNETISLTGFDNNLGTLTGVEISVEGQLTTGGFIQNNSTDQARADYKVNIASDWQVNTAAADNYTFAAADFLNPLLSGESSASGFTLNADEKFNFHQSTALINQSLTNVDLAAFTTGNPVDFNFSAIVFTTGQAFINSGVSSFIGEFSTATYGQVTVSYTYDAVSDIPEPTSIALLALGLVGFSLRKKKSA